MHRRTGEQVSGTARSLILHRERANKVFGKRQARLLIFFATTRPLSKSGAAAYRRLHRWLLRSIRRTIFVSSVPFVFPAAPAQYVFCDQICFIVMFMIYVLSSMLESCMLGLILVMINLVRNLNLQLSIFPTQLMLGVRIQCYNNPV